MGQSSSNQDTRVPDEAMLALVGARVIRGPDWKWGGQDGGEGHLGTVRNCKSSKEMVVVWDNGTTARYRCRGAYDLRILDSGPAGVKHDGYTCAGCSQQSIFGTRWECSECVNYQLCSACYHGDRHNLRHKFFSIDLPGRTRKLVKSRRKSKKISARGLLPGAQVTRGIDWEMEPQDVLSPDIRGKIVEIREWSTSRPRSAAYVQWNIGPRNLYSVGLEGKAELKAVSSAKGYLFYRDHLPALGMSKPCDLWNRFAIGDRVRIDLDLELVQLFQRGHGGWNDKMKKDISSPGTIVAFHENKCVTVLYPGGTSWMLNPAVLILHDSNKKSEATVNSEPPFQIEDVVRISSDIKRVKELQHGHGSWADPMALALGKVDTVKKIDDGGDLMIDVAGSLWIYNPLCVSKVIHIQNETSDSTQVVTPNKSTSDSNVENEEMNQLKQQLISMKEQMLCQICMDRNRNLAFSCGHVTCKECGECLTECPMCRKHIDNRVVLF